MIADVPAFTFPLAAGPATASFEFITGKIAGLPLGEALRVDPCWIDVPDRRLDTNIRPSRFCDSCYQHTIHLRFLFGCCRNGKITPEGITAHGRAASEVAAARRAAPKKAMQYELSIAKKKLYM